MVVIFIFDSGRSYAVEVIIATKQENKIDERGCFKCQYQYDIIHTNVQVKQKGIPQV